jgi:S-adenosylmethionine hydrolase
MIGEWGMVITLTTDFGLSDPYVAAMKGVILELCPQANLVDISHAVSPQNIDEAAFILNGVYRFYPNGTIHVVVVDPGVGTDRAVLAVDITRAVFLVPDNGVLKYIFHDHPKCRVFQVTNESLFLPEVSQTFHGRDIIAPVAAHLANGHPIESVGEPCSDFIGGVIARSVITGNCIRGEIVYVDHFGNGVTNIGQNLLKDHPDFQIRIGNKIIDRLVTSYSDLPAGNLMAIIGSFGSLEIALREGSAQKELDFQIGDPVEINLNSFGD